MLSAAQMRAIEAAAIASGAVTGLELMERAGRGVVAAVFAEWPELQAGSFRAVVLCGPGNNGGDGFVVARLLQEWGWQVEVFLYGTPEGMPPDARVNYERWVGMGAVSGEMPLGEVDVIVDALFGIGLSRPIADDLEQAVDDLVGRTLLANPNSQTKIVAVDILSGTCADSGRPIGQVLPLFAHLTVTFHRAKRGHYVDEGDKARWALRCVDIGLGEDEVAGAVSLTKVWPRRIAKKQGHKFGYGHALILSGGVGQGGAARMAARGALRIGAGLVTVGCPPAALIENAAQLNAIMLRAVTVEGLAGEGLAGENLAGVLEDTRINALCIGPGMGVDKASEILAVALRGAGVQPRPTLIDADALTALARDPALFARLHDRCVLTPHGGEFARLFPDIAARLAAPATRGPAYSKVDATRDAALRAGCVVLFKGPDTVIAGPDGRCSLNSANCDRAAPWLATAGSGDVLAGFICGLLARGFAPFDAACTGAWLHVECARSFGPGLIAEDLAEELPKVFRALGI